VGLFNLSEAAKTLTITWADAGVKGQVKVRDVWRQQNLAPARDQYSAAVPRHGVAFVRLVP